jgi:hypothetical protein
MKPKLTVTGHASPWLLPFTAEPWRRTAYVFLAPLAGLAAVADGGRLQCRLAAALLGRDVPMRRLRGLLALPLDLPTVVIVGYAWSIVALNLAYPARWLIGMGGSYHNSWGGPTFAGAWAFHAVFGGLTFLYLTPWILRGLNHARVRLLGP